IEVDAPQGRPYRAYLDEVVLYQQKQKNLASEISGCKNKATELCEIASYLYRTYQQMKTFYPGEVNDEAFKDRTKVLLIECLTILNNFPEEIEGHLFTQANRLIHNIFYTFLSDRLFKEEEINEMVLPIPLLPFRINAFFTIGLFFEEQGNTNKRNEYFLKATTLIPENINSSIEDDGEKIIFYKGIISSIKKNRDMDFERLLS
ncbi:MAG: hypothetical protein ACFFG0_11245, partial [Candidatus Thorarchaeota archaeon]